jgi:hypothetical protein
VVAAQLMGNPFGGTINAFIYRIPTCLYNALHR